MKKNVIIVLILLYAVYLLSAEKAKYVPTGKAVFPPFVSSQNHGSTRQAPEWSFAIPPLSLLTSYYDYMIGGENNLPVQIQSNEAGAGCYLTYHGKRSTSSPRREFYTYFEHNFNVVVNNEITYAQVDEGFPAVDIDEISGKPIFAWHSNANATDNEMEVSIAWDAYLEGIPGLISEPTISLNNPLSITTTNGITTTDNEFIKPSLQIGHSPLPGHRRAYVLARNNTMHNGYPSENPIIFWADFTPVMLEEGTILTWNIIHIPELDEWNVDQAVWRKPSYALTVGNDGRIYVVGSHTSFSIPAMTPVNEPDLDVFACNNYGQGIWQHYAAFSNLPSWNPPIDNEAGLGFFKNSSDVPYADSDIFWKIQDSERVNAVIDNNGSIHMSAMWTLHTSDNTIYPEFNTIKEMVLDVNSELFNIREIYPIAGVSTDNIIWQPWDTDGNGTVDQYSPINGNPIMYNDWNYSYWDDTAHDGAMRSLYSNIKITEPNSQGWMANVWQNCRRARGFNVYNEDLYNAYTTVPEIYISISKNNGLDWSEPIIMNSVETTQLNGNRPMWVYPSNILKDMGTVNGNLTGRLGLLFYHDNTWGASVLEPPVGPNDGGLVKYMAIDIQIPEVIAPSGLSGIISDGTTHLPISNALVTTAQYEAITDVNGFYTLRAPTGTYTIHVSANGYVSNTISNVLVPSYIVTDFNVSLTLAPPLLAVTGTVLGGTPIHPIANATIHLIGTQAYAGQTNDAGQFNIQGVLGNRQYQYFIFKQFYASITGSITLDTDNYDFGTIFFSDAYNPPSAVTAAILTGNNSVLINWELPTAFIQSKWRANEFEKATVKKQTISDADDTRSLTGYKIWRFPSNLLDNEDTWTLLDSLPASTMSYIDLGWENLNTGFYHYAVKAQYSNDISSSATIAHNVLRLINGSLTGTVMDLSGHPIPEATITITKLIPDGSEPMITTSDSTGVYSISNIRYGDYILNCSANNYLDSSPISIVIVANYTAQQQIDLLDYPTAPANVVATINQENTMVSVSWQLPTEDKQRILLGYRIGRFLEEHIGDSNYWSYIYGIVHTNFYDDTSWEFLNIGTYMYAVQAVYDGALFSEPGFSNPLEQTVEVSDPTNVPRVTRIISASPNPFVSSINISYELKTNRQPKFEIFNINGQRIRTLKNVSSKIGINQITWDGTTDQGEKVTSGIYIYRMIADNQVFNRKMILLK